MNEHNVTASRAEAAQEQLRRHPRGLVTLAGTELWERLGFYGLQVILAYYIYYSVADGGLGMSHPEALAIAGAYGGCVYMLQPLGTWLADRLLAVRYVVLLSGFLIVAGHLTVAGTSQLPGLLLGLGLLTLGTGGLFPNILAMMGSLYEDRPVKRDSGFSIFYTGILVGALAGPLLTGFLHVRFGFSVAFSAAAVGMGIGLVIYLMRWSTLPDSAGRVPHPLDTQSRRRAAIIGIFAVVAGIGAVASPLVTLGNIDTVVLLLIIIASVTYFLVMMATKSTTRGERKKVLSFIPIYLAAVVFWVMVLQLFTTFAVYADTRVDLTLGPVEIPPSYISTFQVVAGIMAGPLIGLLWERLGRRQPRTVTKLVIGLGLMAVAYATFALLPALPWHGAHVSLLPVILGMVVFGIAEVTFAPIGISAAAQLAPRSFKSQMMALWGLTMAAGASLSGSVGQLYDREHEALFFGLISGAVLVTAAMLLALRGPIERQVDQSAQKGS